MKLGICAILMFVLGAGMCLAAETKPPASLVPDVQPDEKEVAAIIDALGSADFAAREAAQTELKAMGAELMPILQKYRDHEDPEVAARVVAVINAFAWVSQGAIIIKIERDMPAERIGLKAGDVIFKVNGQPVKSHMDTRRMNPREEATIQIWRAGQLLTFKLPPGRAGYSVVNWDIAKGGNNQSRGIALLSVGKGRDLEQAYKRLRAARAEGLDDPWSIRMLAGLAARQLDSAYAHECYLQMCTTGYSCNFSHGDSREYMSLPFQSPHTAYLLERYRTEAFSPMLYHDLQDWFSRNAHNYPLAREIIAKPWPVGANASPMQVSYDITTRMRVRLYEGKWDEVLAEYSRWPMAKQDYDERAMALTAAVRGGNVARAVDVALAIMESPGDFYGDPERPLHALALAGVMGDDGQVERFLAGLVKADAKLLEKMSGAVGGYSLFCPAMAKYLLPFFDKNPSVASVGRFPHIRAALLGGDPGTTKQQFDAFIPAVDPKPWKTPLYHSLLAGMLRFGEYDRAAEFAQQIAKESNSFNESRNRVMAVVNFAKANAAELAGEWKDLTGTMQVVPGREKGTTWALRWDGHVFFIDAAKKLHDYPGLDAPGSPLTVGYPHLLVTASNVRCRFPLGRNTYYAQGAHGIDMPWIFDEKAQRWVSAVAYEGDFDIGGEETTDTLAAREVARRYGAYIRPTRRIERWETMRWFEGNIFTLVDPKSKKVLDCSAEIGRLSGLGRSAQVYGLSAATPPRQMLLSEVGLWMLDIPQMKIERIPLGLKNENVMLCSLSWEFWERSKDFELIAIAPQFGGQIYRVDTKTLKAELTNGFCGNGPDDWYTRKYRYAPDSELQDSIHVEYLKRLAAQRK